MPFQVSPTDGGKVLYGIGSKLQLVGGIPCSYDQGDTWTACFVNKTNLTGILKQLHIKNETVLIAQRLHQIPLRSIDGGETWQPMHSLVGVEDYIHQFSYSWSGKTLVMFGVGGDKTTSHTVAAIVWKSLDDGDTWTDETTEDIVTMGAGLGQWYENSVYMNSGGQGIFYKVFE